MKNLPNVPFKVSDEVRDALESGRPVVSLESTVIAHGLPFPHNLETAVALESEVRNAGAVPATVAVLGGAVRVGLDHAQIERLADGRNVRKISRRDLAIAVARRLDCATTVATTAWVAYRAGIRVFATGGIGGVHRGFSADVSADLPELGRTPITVVCSGAKIVLDLPATREWLETNGIPVIGWQCDEMPAFYSRSSGLETDARADSAEDAAAIVRARDDLGLEAAILLTVPVPAAFEIGRPELETMIEAALAAAEGRGITGKAITPFLLSEMAANSGGRTLGSNIALLRNNASVAASVAGALAA